LFAESLAKASGRSKGAPASLSRSMRNAEWPARNIRASQIYRKAQGAGLAGASFID